MSPEPPRPPAKRLAPRRPFPPYAYIGDPQPHPRNHPQGHSRNVPEAIPPPLDPDRWHESEDYLHGIDLFHHGYYWEAHEAWEGLWLAAGKTGPVAELMKGLIKLTAAGVKARQAQPEGVRRHAESARGHFQRTREMIGRERYAGLAFRDLEEFCREVAERAREWPSHAGKDVAVVFPGRLEPS